MAAVQGRTMRVSRLLIVTTAFEGTTGLLLLLLPAVVLAWLFGWREIGRETALMGRVAGAAVLGLSVASWMAREDGGSRAERALLTGLLIYNVVAFVLLAVAGTTQHMIGLLLWPAVLYHGALTVWCAVCIGRGRPEGERR